MKITKLLFVSSLSILMLAGSCVSQRKSTYLQYSDIEGSDFSTIDQTVLVTPAEYKIMPYDNLFIRVITPDPQWSAIFNASSGDGGAMTEESASLLGYRVDVNGNIDIPFVGEIKVEGLTLAEIKSRLDTTFKNYLKDAAISVKLVNNYINIIGEVNTPGRYPLTKDRVNIFEALAMAGDLNIYSNRRKIHLIRSSPYGPVVKEFNLLDRSILKSEYFYMMPNDIIYAPPLKGKTFQMNSSIYSMILSSIATLLTIVVFFRSAG